jgi:hypothetical protein
MDEFIPRNKPSPSKEITSMSDGMPKSYFSFYPPGFELKRQYQKNILIGMASSILLAFAFSIFIFLSEDQNSIPSAIKGVSLSDSTIHFDKSIPIANPKPARRKINTLNPFDAVHKGFSGFNGYNVVRDFYEPNMEIKPPKIYTHELFTVVQESVLSYSSIEGLDTEISISPYLDNVALLPDSMNDSVTNMGPGIIFREEPTVPFIARERKIEGIVEVLMYIDALGVPSPFSARPVTNSNSQNNYQLDIRMKDGRLSHLEFFIDPIQKNNTLMNLVLKEEPESFFFADKLTKALPEWRFRPRIVKGKPKGSFAVLRYMFFEPSKHPKGFRPPEVLISS